MKKIFKFALVLLLIMLCTNYSFAFDSEEHDEILTEVLFGDYYNSIKSNPKLSKLVKILNEASYLSIDQFDNKNGGYEKGLNAYNSLKSAGVPNLSKIDEISYNAAGTNHRMYTHRGWFDPQYNNSDIQYGHWDKRKNILLQAVNKVFKFKFLTSGLNENELCNAMAALIYEVHLIGDHIYDYEQLRDGKKTKFYFAREQLQLGGRTDKNDVIDEILKLMPILFESQKSTDKYRVLRENLKSCNSEMNQILRLEGELNTLERQIEYLAYAEKVKKALTDYIPNLLRNEDYFNKIFYK